MPPRFIREPLLVIGLVVAGWFGYGPHVGEVGVFDIVMCTLGVLVFGLIWLLSRAVRDDDDDDSMIDELADSVDFVQEHVSS